MKYSFCPAMPRKPSAWFFYPLILLRSLFYLTKEFLEALKKIEQLKSPEGPSFGELLKEGRLDGITLESDKE